MAQIGRGGTITLDAVYRDGSQQAVDPVGPNVDIIDALGATVVLNAVPTHDGLGSYHYNYAVAADAPLGAWQIVWQGTVNGGPVEAPEGFTVVPAGTVMFPEATTRTCDLWCTADDVGRCGECSSDTDTVAWAIEVATSVLYKLSGERYPGLCTDTVRPVNGALGLCGDRYVRDAIIQGKLYSTDYRGCGVHGFSGCACGGFQQVRLGGKPVKTILSVKVDGATLDPADYSVLDETWLVRTDDGTFPCCQDARKPSTEDGTFEVSYQYGIAPPADGVAAAAKLACELSKSCDPADGTCELPERVTTLTRQGVTMAVIDPQIFLNDGRTGLYLVDLFLATTTRNIGASVQSPDYGPMVRRRS